MENKPTNQSAQIQEQLIQDIKDSVAKSKLFADWDLFFRLCNNKERDRAINEVILEYASSQLEAKDREIEKLKDKCEKYAVMVFDLQHPKLQQATASSGEREDGEDLTKEKFLEIIQAGDDPDDIAEQCFQLACKRIWRLPHPSTKQSVNPPAQEVDVEKLAEEKYGNWDDSAVEALKMQHWKRGFKDCQALQSKSVGYNKTDLERMYLLGLLNRESMDMNTLSKELEKARTKIDLAINFIQSLTSTPLQTKGREVDYSKISSLRKEIQNDGIPRTEDEFCIELVRRITATNNS